MTEPSNRFGPHGHARLKASSWSVASPNGKGTERQPHLFYNAGEVDRSIDELKERHAFEMRRVAALEAFYLKEISRRYDRSISLFEGPLTEEMGFNGGTPMIAAPEPKNMENEDD